MMAWAVQHTTTLIVLYSADGGGKCPMQRARGQGQPKEIAEFGEKVLFQPVVTYSAVDKLVSRWHYGLFLGINLRASEVVLVKTDDGAIVMVWSYVGPRMASDGTPMRC